MGKMMPGYEIAIVDEMGERMPVGEIGRKCPDRPLPFPHRVRPGEEVWKVTEVKLPLAAFAFKQKLLAPRFETIMQVAEKFDCLSVQKAFLGVWLSCRHHIETPLGKSMEREHLVNTSLSTIRSPSKGTSPNRTSARFEP